MKTRHKKDDKHRTETKIKEGTPQNLQLQNKYAKLKTNLNRSCGKEKKKIVSFSEYKQEKAAMDQVANVRMENKRKTLRKKRKTVVYDVLDHVIVSFCSGNRAQL